MNQLQQVQFLLVFHFYRQSKCLQYACTGWSTRNQKEIEGTVGQWKHTTLDCTFFSGNLGVVLHSWNYFFSRVDFWTAIYLGFKSSSSLLQPPLHHPVEQRRWLPAGPDPAIPAAHWAAVQAAQAGAQTTCPRLVFCCLSLGRAFRSGRKLQTEDFSVNSR